GGVKVHQDPAKPEEKGTEVEGDKLTMTCTPQGNLLVVEGDLAQLRMDKLYVLGPEVNIDQAANKAWVHGVGAMQMESTTNFQGKKAGQADDTHRPLEQEHVLQRRVGRVPRRHPGRAAERPPGLPAPRRRLRQADLPQGGAEGGPVAQGA